MVDARTAHALGVGRTEHIAALNALLSPRRKKRMLKANRIAVTPLEHVSGDYVIIDAKEMSIRDEYTNTSVTIAYRPEAHCIYVNVTDSMFLGGCYISMGALVKHIRQAIVEHYGSAPATDTPPEIKPPPKAIKPKRIIKLGEICITDNVSS